MLMTKAMMEMRMIRLDAKKMLIWPRCPARYVPGSLETVEIM